MVPSITASHPGPEAAKQPQTITLPPPCLTAGMMFILWNHVLVLCQMQRDTHTFQKLSHQSTEYFPQILEDNGDIFWQIWDKPLFSFWSAVAFSLELSHGCRFCPFSFLFLNHEHWPLCCSGFFYDLLYEPYVKWVVLALLGRFITVTSFLHVWIMALTVVCWSPKDLEIAFI